MLSTTIFKDSDFVRRYPVFNLQNINKVKANNFDISAVKDNAARIVNKTQLPDFYTSQKEEIPSYLLFERFLICFAELFNFQ